MPNTIIPNAARRLRALLDPALPPLASAPGRYDRLIDALRQIDILETDLIQVLGKSTPQLANVNTLRGIVLVSEERFAEAAEEYGKAQELFGATIGTDSPFTLSTLQYRAEALRWAGKSAQAIWARKSPSRPSTCGHSIAAGRCGRPPSRARSAARGCNTRPPQRSALPFPAPGPSRSVLSC